MDILKLNKENLNLLISHEFNKYATENQKEGTEKEEIEFAKICNLPTETWHNISIFFYHGFMSAVRAIEETDQIKVLKMTIATTGKDLKDAIKKNRLFAQIVDDPGQQEILKLMIDHISNCPSCESKLIEKINKCESCIYLDSCKDENKIPGCRKRVEVV